MEQVPDQQKETKLKPPKNKPKNSSRDIVPGLPGTKHINERGETVHSTGYVEPFPASE